MKSLTITFLRLPPPELMPNRSRSLHWAKLGSMAADARREGFWLGTEALSVKKWPTPPKASIKYTFRVKDKRVRDLDALVRACKPWLDGLVDSGVLVDDSGWVLSIAGAELVLGDKNETVLEIRRLEK